MKTLLALSAALLAACATAPEFRVPTQTLAPGIYHVKTGTAVTYDALIADLQTREFILLAESHDSVSDHLKQKEIYTSLTEASDRPVCLGMEMFQTPYQAALDDYLRGTIDETEMLARTEWETRWGFATELYAPLWRRAKATNNPIIALNAPREMTKRIAKVGRTGLDEDEARSLPQMATGNKRYKHFLGEVFAAHGASMDDQTLQRFFEAQLLWDETMAASAVAASKTHECKVALIVGRGHVENDYGIPSRLRRRIGETTKRVVSVVPVSGTVPTWERLRGARFADYIWVD